jgi:TRAP-type C4-dicarboxylate transport system permease small subunit
MKKLGLIVWKGLVYFQKSFIIFAGCLVAVLVFIEVMLRYVLGSPLFGIEELIVLIAMWLYFLGASYGAYERSHIKADLVHLWFRTPRSLALVNAVTCLITVVLAVVMVSWTYPYIVWSIKKGGTTQALLLPRVYSQMAILISAVLMSFYFFVEFLDYLRKSFSKDPATRVSSREEQ